MEVKLARPVFLSLFFISFLTGCAPHVHRTPAPLTAPVDQRQRLLHIRTPVTVKLPTGYTRLIKQDSTWRFVGTMPQGEVFQPVNDVFTIEGANSHEAYLVITAGHLVGFYLPGESAFSALPNKVSLVTE